jgi:cytochrome c peroxidase
MAFNKQYVATRVRSCGILALSMALSVCTALSAMAGVSQEYLRPASVPAPGDNQWTHERSELGKMLFFDPRLSGSNWISCATCHNPALGWSDGLPTAIGNGQKVLGRATPTILNAAYNPLQMWDGRFRSLEKQALGPMTAAGEMNQDLGELENELKAITGYVKLFNQAYPGEGINKDTIAKAIASFERTIVSTEAPFDRWVKGDKNAISTAAQKGFKLFEGKAGCSKCHSGFNFSDNGFHNIGLKSDDQGRFAIRKVKILKGAFKTPTLRDIEYTAPYMHNGQYKTLEEVVDHYNRGGDVKENLSPNIQALNLSAEEKHQLVEFMKALSGKQMVVSVPRLPN